MAVESINWMAGGPQGSGVDTAANIFARACGYGGLYVFGRREYHSNIKGLHSYFHLRISKKETLSNVNAIELLAAFDAETVIRHIKEVTPGGGIIVDTKQLTLKVLEIPTLPCEYKTEIQKFMKENSIGETLNDWLNYAKRNGIEIFTVPYEQILTDIAPKIGITQIGKMVRIINVLTVGISFALLKFDKQLVEKAVRSVFAEKEKIAEMNAFAVNFSYDYAEKNFQGNFKHKLEKLEINEDRIFLTGNQAVAIGKVAGGCRVQTYYPITPAADESEYLEANEIIKTSNGEEAVLVIQSEDEIAAINTAS
ncbi:MAG: 2-oxoglutarate ferredoxin oxidoreductase subunit alpha, partial [Crenarchaeota archaeon]|nr:2-oxoglutarate ferredoxin oxidoreductase subunit alpha [Thermoproteota archaeon]